MSGALTGPWHVYAPAFAQLASRATELAEAIGGLGDTARRELGGELNFIRTQVGRLDINGDLGSAVARGDPGSESAWAKRANATADNCAALGERLREYGFSAYAGRFMDEVVVRTFVQTGNVIKDGVNAAAKAVVDPPSLVKWVVGGLCAWAVSKVVGLAK